MPLYPETPLYKFCNTPKTVSLNLKGQNLKKIFFKYPATIEEIISFRLIPLLTYVSFCCTVPLRAIVFKDVFSAGQELIPPARIPFWNNTRPGWMQLKNFFL
jgi:hypothetical protein